MSHNITRKLTTRGQLPLQSIAAHPRVIDVLNLLRPTNNHRNSRGFDMQRTQPTDLTNHHIGPSSRNYLLASRKPLGK